MIMRLYNGLKNFLEPVTVYKRIIDDPDAIKPTAKDVAYKVEGSIALIDGTEESFRPGGKVNIGDLYLQTLAGDKIPLIETDTPNSIALVQGDKIEYLGDIYEIYFVRNEPSVCDIADYYASKVEVDNNAR